MGVKDHSPATIQISMQRDCVTLTKQKIMRVEYLVIIDSTSAFCGNIKAFNSFLESNSDIKIHGKTFNYKHMNVNYEIQTGIIKTDNNRFFHIKFNSENIEEIDDFTELLRAVRSLLFKAADKQPQTLWDDLSFYYAEKSYPLIHEIENLMRKLITKFMLTNVGLGWTKDTIPEDLKKERNISIENNYNYLYETDFIQLANFLFEEYKTIDAKSLIEKLKSATTLEEIGIDELKGFIPKSNWDRYFSGYVDCEDSYLRNRWQNLYKLRCKIAHNNAVSKTDYEQIVKLVHDIKPKLEKAIDNLDKVEVPEDDRENLAESVAINTNALYGEYLQKWKSLEKQLYNLISLELNVELDKDDHRNLRYITSKTIKILVDNGIIEKSLYSRIQEARDFRNAIVHEADLKFSESELHYKIQNLTELNMVINEYIARNNDEPF